MALNRVIEAEDQDQGDWEQICKHPTRKDGEGNPVTVEWRIRRIPAEFERELRSKTGTRGLTLRMKKKGDREVDVNLDTEEGKTLARAVHALTDTRNFDIEIGGPKAAEVYSKLLGRPVQVGEEVLLDGFWSEAVKRQYLSGDPPMAAKVETIALKRARAFQEEDLELGEI